MAQTNQGQNWWDIASDAISRKGSVEAAALEVTGRRYSGEVPNVPLKDAEHYLFARSRVEGNRLWIPVLTVGIPLWDMIKVPGYKLGWSDTPANWKEINAAGVLS